VVESPQRSPVRRSSFVTAARPLVLGQAWYDHRAGGSFSSA
jgi:hypothetical protein